MPSPALPESMRSMPWPAMTPMGNRGTVLGWGKLSVLVGIQRAEGGRSVGYLVGIHHPVLVDIQGGQQRQGRGRRRSRRLFGRDLRLPLSQTFTFRSWRPGTPGWTGRVRGRDVAQFATGDLAIAVFVERFESHGSVGQFGAVQGSVTISV